MLDIIYQSMATAESVARLFAPHALLFTGQRWLVRGWDNRHQAHRDLALARIVSARSVGEVGDGLPRDDRWHDYATLEIGLREGLSPGQAEVTAREFGMHRDADGIYFVHIEPRQAMVPYVLDHLRLRSMDQTRQAVPIRLCNYDEIRDFDRLGASG